MADKEWRPSDWGKIRNSICLTALRCDGYARNGCQCCEKLLALDETASAMFKALIKYLWEPCSEHLIPNGKEIDFTIMFEPVYLKGLFYRHRFNCPSCMRQLQESGL